MKNKKKILSVALAASLALQMNVPVIAHAAEADAPKRPAIGSRLSAGILDLSSQTIVGKLIARLKAYQAETTGPRYELATTAIESITIATRDMRMKPESAHRKIGFEITRAVGYLADVFASKDAIQKETERLQAVTQEGIDSPDLTADDYATMYIKEDSLRVDIRQARKYRSQELAGPLKKELRQKLTEYIHDADRLLAKNRITTGEVWEYALLFQQQFQEIKTANEGISAEIAEIDAAKKILAEAIEKGTALRKEATGTEHAELRRALGKALAEARAVKNDASASKEAVDAQIEALDALLETATDALATESPEEVAEDAEEAVDAEDNGEDAAANKETDAEVEEAQVAPDVEEVPAE